MVPQGEAIAALCVVNASTVSVHTGTMELTSEASEAVSQCAVDIVDGQVTETRHSSAVITAPLLGSDAHVLGAVVVVSTTNSDLHESLLVLVDDVVRSVELELRADEMSRSIAATRAAQQVKDDFDSSLAAVAAATNRSMRPREVVRAVARHGEAAAGASLISLGMVEGPQLQFFHGDGVPDIVANTWSIADLDTPVPMTIAASTGEAVVLADRARFAQWPVFEQAVEGLGLNAFMALPIYDSSDATIAVIGLGFTEPLLSSEIPTSIRRLLAVTGQALHRATELETAQNHAVLLESIVLPSQLPLSPDVELHGRYLPPLVNQRVGGDLFDAWVRNDGTTAVFVADVAGHTLAAARTTTRLRHSVGMLALEKRPPDEILEAVNAYVQNASSMHLATCCLCVVDPANNTVTIANAGHPQPILRSADGSVRPVGPVGQTLLGYGQTKYAKEVVEFESGDAIVMYTDGLIERRGATLTSGERWLENELSNTTALSAAEISALLISDLDSVRDDDIVVMVIQRSPKLVEPEATDLHATWTAEELSLSDARALVRSWLDTVGAQNNGIAVDDVMLVLTELLTNARRASPRSDSQIGLLCEAVGARVDVRVSNEGEGFAVRPTMPATDAARGRGLAISASLADLSVEDDGTGEIRVRASFTSE